MDINHNENELLGDEASENDVPSKTEKTISRDDTVGETGHQIAPWSTDDEPTVAEQLVHEGTELALNETLDSAVEEETELD